MMFELTFRLDAGSGRPLYEQIYQYIKNEIQNGGLPCLERLPSTRNLAKHLQVSRSTVTLAYEQLLSEGYVENRPGSGYYVSRLEGLYHFPKESFASGEKKGRETSGYAYDFTPFGVDLGSFPYNNWRKLSRQLLMEENQELFQLGDAAGEWGLREAIAGYVHQARGVCCTPEQIIIGAGNDYLLMLLDVLLGKERIYALENPTYRKAYDIFRALDRKVKTISMDSRGMIVEELEKSGADIAYVMPSHHFPLGTIMPAGRRLQLLQWADPRQGRYIIEDDYDSEFRYKGRPIPALQGLDGQGKVIYIGTFSKSIAPAIRISFLILPPTLLERYQKLGRSFSSTVSRMDQRILERFLREGYYERHLNRMRALYKSRHDAMLECLKEFRDCRVFGDYAGTHMLLEIQKEITEEEILSRARKAGVGVSGLSAYCIGEKPRKSILLLGYATMEEQKITAGLKCLLQILE